MAADSKLEVVDKIEVPGETGIEAGKIEHFETILEQNSGPEPLAGKVDPGSWPLLYRVLLVHRSEILECQY